MISRGTEATCFVLTLCFSSLFFTYPLLNIHFFLQDPIQECRFHIHLMHLPFSLSRYCQQQTNCFSSEQNFHHTQYHTFAYQCSKNRPSRIRLEVDRDESDTRYLDSAWIGWTRMSRSIFRVNSVNSGKKFNRFSAKSPTTNLDFSEKSEIPLQKKTYETYENLKKNPWRFDKPVSPWPFQFFKSI